MTSLTVPDFKLSKPNPSDLATDAEWWLWLQLDMLEPSGQLGGIYADKSGFHNTGAKNKNKWPGNYSIRDAVNQSGPGWTNASAIDWTFPDAQRGDYKTIAKYTKRLWNSSHDPKDPRLDLILFEFYGQMDSDRYVEGYNELHENAETSDSSHLWHLHMSLLRKYCGDFWRMWALFTVLAGWSVSKWRDSLPATDKNSSKYKPSTPAKPAPAKPSKPSTLPHYELGSRTLKAGVSPGTDVAYVQRFIGPKLMGKDDGVPGPKFTAGVKWYQREIMGFKNPDGVLTKGGPTWDKLDGK